MISVVIPTHNRRSLLKRAVRSVQKQSCPDIEILVVSDGSTDGTDRCMEELAKEDPRIHYHCYPESKGANHARNIGISLSKGEYIAFLDDDDEWLPEKLEKQKKILDENERVGLVYSHVNLLDRTGKTYAVNKTDICGDASKAVLFGGFIYTTSCVMARKTVLEDAGCFDEQLPAMQDYDMWIRCCQITEVDLIREPLVNYSSFGNSGREQIGNKTQRYLDANSIIEQKHSRLFAQLTDSENKRRQYIIYKALSNRAKANREKKEMRYCAVMALRKIRTKEMLKNVLVTFLPGDLTFSYRQYLHFRRNKPGK